MKRVYIFNPDHDLALASDSDHFDAPQSAVQFAEDFSYLPLWFAEQAGAVKVSSLRIDWFLKMYQLFPQLQQFSLTQSFPQGAFCVNPWGWNKTLRRTLQNADCEQIPSIEKLEKLRQLQHRAWAIRATEFLQSLASPTLKIAPPASEITETEIANFVAKNPYAIFKAPWSGSGKGIVRSLNGLTENLLNCVKNVAHKQGSVIAEPLYDRIQDFAMEFVCENGIAKFVGYSFFTTNVHGAYTGNLLATDSEIVNRLSSWILPENLEKIKQKITEFILLHIAPKYDGFVGVDMFVFRKNGEIWVHPCVEFNLRTTMGLVARKFYDLFVEQGAVGTYSVDFYKSPQELLAKHNERVVENPLEVKNGKIQKGYISLVPFSAEQHYVARVEITQE